MCASVGYAKKAGSHAVDEAWRRSGHRQTPPTVTSSPCRDRRQEASRHKATATLGRAEGRTGGRARAPRYEAMISGAKITRRRPRSRPLPPQPARAPAAAAAAADRAAPALGSAALRGCRQQSPRQRRPRSSSSPADRYLSDAAPAAPPARNPLFLHLLRLVIRAIAAVAFPPPRRSAGVPSWDGDEEEEPTLRGDEAASSPPPPPIATPSPRRSAMSRTSRRCFCVGYPPRGTRRKGVTAPPLPPQPPPQPPLQPGCPLPAPPAHPRGARPTTAAARTGWRTRRPKCRKRRRRFRLSASA